MAECLRGCGGIAGIFPISTLFAKDGTGEKLYTGVKGEAELAALGNFVSLFRVIHVTPEIAKAAGLYKRDYGRSHGFGLADAIFATTAEAENAELKTLNTRHYPMLRNLRPAWK